MHRTSSPPEKPATQHSQRSRNLFGGLDIDTIMKNAKPAQRPRKRGDRYEQWLKSPSTPTPRGKKKKKPKATRAPAHQVDRGDDDFADCLSGCASGVRAGGDNTSQPSKKVRWHMHQARLHKKTGLVPFMAIWHKLRSQDREGALMAVMSSADALNATAQLDPKLPRSILKEALQHAGFTAGLQKMHSKLPANAQSPIEALQSLSQDLEGGVDEMMQKLGDVVVECKEALAQRPEFKFPQDLIKFVDPTRILEMIGKKMPTPLDEVYRKMLARSAPMMPILNTCEHQDLQGEAIPPAVSTERGSRAGRVGAGSESTGTFETGERGRPLHAPVEGSALLALPAARSSRLPAARSSRLGAAGNVGRISLQCREDLAQEDLAASSVVGEETATMTPASDETVKGAMAAVQEADKVVMDVTGAQEEEDATGTEQTAAVPAVSTTLSIVLRGVTGRAHSLCVRRDSTVLEVKIQFATAHKLHSSHVQIAHVTRWDSKVRVAILSDDTSLGSIHQDKTPELRYVLRLLGSGREGNTGGYFANANTDPCVERKLDSELCPDGCDCGNALPAAEEHKVRAVKNGGLVVGSKGVCATADVEKGEILTCFGDAAYVGDKPRSRVVQFMERVVTESWCKYTLQSRTFQDGLVVFVVPGPDADLLLQKGTGPLKTELLSRGPAGIGHLINHSSCRAHVNAELEVQWLSGGRHRKRWMATVVVLSTRRIKAGETVLLQYTPDASDCQGGPSQFKCTCCVCRRVCGELAGQRTSAVFPGVVLVRHINAHQATNKFGHVDFAESRRWRVYGIGITASDVRNLSCTDNEANVQEVSVLAALLRFVSHGHSAPFHLPACVHSDWVVDPSTYVSLATLWSEHEGCDLTGFLGLLADRRATKRVWTTKLQISPYLYRKIHVPVRLHTGGHLLLACIDTNRRTMTLLDCSSACCAGERSAVYLLTWLWFLASVRHLREDRGDQISDPIWSFVLGPEGGDQLGHLCGFPGFTDEKISRLADLRARNVDNPDDAMASAVSIIGKDTMVELDRVQIQFRWDRAACDRWRWSADDEGHIPSAPPPRDSAAFASLVVAFRLRNWPLHALSYLNHAQTRQWVTSVLSHDGEWGPVPSTARGGNRADPIEIASGGEWLGWTRLEWLGASQGQPCCGVGALWSEVHKRVTSIEPQGAAAGAGIQKHDLIVRVNSRNVAAEGSLHLAGAPGASFVVTVQRARGQEHVCVVVLKNDNIGANAPPGVSCIEHCMTAPGETTERAQMDAWGRSQLLLMAQERVLRWLRQFTASGGARWRGVAYIRMMLIDLWNDKSACGGGLYRLMETRHLEDSVEVLSIRRVVTPEVSEDVSSVLCKPADALVVCNEARAVLEKCGFTVADGDDALRILRQEEGLATWTDTLLDVVRSSRWLSGMSSALASIILAAEASMPLSQSDSLVQMILDATPMVRFRPLHSWLRLELSLRRSSFGPSLCWAGATLAPALHDVGDIVHVTQACGSTSVMVVAAPATSARDMVVWDPSNRHVRRVEGAVTRVMPTVETTTILKMHRLFVLVCTGLRVATLLDGGALNTDQPVDMVRYVGRKSLGGAVESFPCAPPAMKEPATGVEPAVLRGFIRGTPMLLRHPMHPALAARRELVKTLEAMDRSRASGPDRPVDTRVRGGKATGPVPSRAHASGSPVVGSVCEVRPELDEPGGQGNGMDEPGGQGNDMESTCTTPEPQHTGAPAECLANLAGPLIRPCLHALCREPPRELAVRRWTRIIPGADNCLQIKGADVKWPRRTDVTDQCVDIVRGIEKGCEDFRRGDVDITAACVSHSGFVVVEKPSGLHRTTVWVQDDPVLRLVGEVLGITRPQVRDLFDQVTGMDQKSCAVSALCNQVAPAGRETASNGPGLAKRVSSSELHATIPGAAEKLRQGPCTEAPCADQFWEMIPGTSTTSVALLSSRLSRVRDRLEKDEGTAPSHSSCRGGRRAAGETAVVQSAACQALAEALAKVIWSGCSTCNLCLARLVVQNAVRGNVQDHFLSQTVGMSTAQLVDKIVSTVSGQTKYGEVALMYTDEVGVDSTRHPIMWVGPANLTVARVALENVPRVVGGGRVLVERITEQSSGAEKLIDDDMRVEMCCPGAVIRVPFKRTVIERAQPRPHGGQQESGERVGGAGSVRGRAGGAAQDGVRCENVSTLHTSPALRPPPLPACRVTPLWRRDLA